MVPRRRIGTPLEAFASLSQSPKVVQYLAPCLSQNYPTGGDLRAAFWQLARQGSSARGEGIADVPDETTGPGMGCTGRTRCSEGGISLHRSLHVWGSSTTLYKGRCSEPTRAALGIHTPRRLSRARKAPMCPPAFQRRRINTRGLAR